LGGKKKETLKAFGQDDLYVEKFIPNARHIEIQILKDKAGHIQIFPERDCSIQRRHQKIIEETPAIISPQLRNKIFDTTKKALQQIDYVGSGTIEYVVDENENFYFMEMNTRIQVEHGITEVATEVDLIKSQIEIAQNKNITEEEKKSSCHVIECRINAEDSKRNFLPCCGDISALHFPTGLGIRIDSHIYTGYKVLPYCDSLLAKLIVRGEDRQECLLRTHRALVEFIVEGIHTTIPFCLEYINQELKK
jgi:acetyl-CoA carboxylase biotin carboxylase subunit